MILKKTFEYSNYLQGLRNQVLTILSRKDNVTTTTQEHMRSKTFADGLDETVEKPRDFGVEAEINDLVDFLMYVINEEETLSTAIADAKSTASIDIDSSVSMNKAKQYVSGYLQNMVDIKSSERQTTGTGKKFNEEGNQVSYTYDIKEVTSIDFDRNKVKGIVKRLRAECDDVSSTLDKIQVELEVNFTPTFTVGDSLEDCLETFLSK